MAVPAGIYSEPNRAELGGHSRSLLFSILTTARKLQKAGLSGPDDSLGAFLFRSGRLMRESLQRHLHALGTLI
jgi:hypothetical protein